MLSEGKLILDTELVKIFFTGSEHRVFIAISQGGVLEHEPFPGDLRGLVAALDLARECCAGKFFPKCVVKENERITSIPKALKERTK